MIGTTRQVRVFVYRDPVDMRKAHDSLSALLTGHLEKTLTSGDLFAFVGKTRKRAKVLYFDGTGSNRHHPFFFFAAGEALVPRGRACGLCVLTQAARHLRKTWQPVQLGACG